MRGRRAKSEREESEMRGRREKREREKEGELSR